MNYFRHLKLEYGEPRNSSKFTICKKMYIKIIECTCIVIVNKIDLTDEGFDCM